MFDDQLKNSSGCSHILEPDCYGSQLLRSVVFAKLFGKLVRAFRTLRTKSAGGFHPEQWCRSLKLSYEPHGIYSEISKAYSSSSLDLVMTLCYKDQCRREAGAMGNTAQLRGQSCPID